jgi:hypothetical protein
VLNDTIILRQISELGRTRCDLALPSDARRWQIRRAVDHFDPVHVVFYGASAFSRNPEEVLEFWRAKYPEISFYSLGAHGAIRIEFHSGGLIIVPTLPDFLTGDA